MFGLGKVWDVATGIAEVAVPGGRIAKAGIEGLRSAAQLKVGLEAHVKLSPEKQRIALAKSTATLTGVCEEQQEEIDTIVEALQAAGIPVSFPGGSQTNTTIPEAETANLIEGVPFSSQADGRWKDKEMAPGKRIQAQGCGLCTIAMHLAHITADDAWAPDETFHSLLDVGAYDGKSAALQDWSAVAKLFGAHTDKDWQHHTLRTGMFDPAIYDRVREQVDNGLPAIVRLAKQARAPEDWRSEWSTGHFVLAVGYTPAPTLPNGLDIIFHNPGRLKGSAYEDGHFNSLRTTETPYLPVGVDWFEQVF